MLFVSFLAIFTKPGGARTTTIKNALSDLYNMSFLENNDITGNLVRKIPYTSNLIRVFNLLQTYRNNFHP